MRVERQTLFGYVVSMVCMPSIRKTLLSCPVPSCPALSTFGPQDERQRRRRTSETRTRTRTRTMKAQKEENTYV
jgi:hypothetical protein